MLKEEPRKQEKTEKTVSRQRELSFSGMDYRL